MNGILMVYWMSGQVSTMMSIVMQKGNFSMGYMILIRVLMMLCKSFWSTHLSNTSIIYLLGSGRGIFGGLGMHFDNFGSLRAPVLGLLISLVSYVELVH